MTTPPSDLCSLTSSPATFAELADRLDAILARLRELNRAKEIEAERVLAYREQLTRPKA